MPRIAVFGAAPDTLNMGVSALFASTLSSISRLIPNCEFVVFDGGLGERRKSFLVSEDQSIDCILYGARAGFRWYRPENLAAMSTLASLGPLGPLLNSGVKLIESCDAVLDVSGGDSFSDIYGRRRFFSVARPKMIALKRDRPLVLLPQTYGPYNNLSLRETASEIVKGAGMAWARDLNSFEVLKELLGARFDPNRHLCGVDLAFMLAPRLAASELADRHFWNWLDAPNSTKPLIGFNVNGLIFNDPDRSRSQYGFRADYSAVVQKFLTWILDNTECNILLVPHVMVPEGHFESDYAASLAVADKLPKQHEDRVAITPTSLDQCQVKWVISKTDWFCGTRMHSTIAALSSGVPTASVAYSDKTKGVFESCHQGEHVWDPRTLSTEEVFDGLVQSYQKRTTAKEALVERLPAVKSIARKQIEAIAEFIANATR